MFSGYAAGKCGVLHPRNDGSYSFARRTLEGVTWPSRLAHGFGGREQGDRDDECHLDVSTIASSTCSMSSGMCRSSSNSDNSASGTLRTSSLTILIGRYFASHRIPVELTIRLMWKRWVEPPKREKKAKFYADEDIEEGAVAILRECGVNISSARELGHRG